MPERSRACPAIRAAMLAAAAALLTPCAVPSRRRPERPGLPLAARSHAGFIAHVDERGAAGGGDPILCDQDVPPRYELDSAVMLGELASVAVHPRGANGQSFTVHREHSATGWQIADIHCPAP